jgi:2-C-methyl-D-erythritol 4-phosphate cytidylyltransferase
MPRAWAVVPAAGSSRRMGSGVAKQFLPLCGKTVLAHALVPLLACDRIAGVVLVLPADDTRGRALAPPDERLLIAKGGAERCHSVQHGLERLDGRAGEDDWVLVHDAARPCLAGEALESLFQALGTDAVGGLLAEPLADTLKAVDEAGRAARTVPRDGLWRALTPQMFRYGMLRQALATAIADGVMVTDEAAAMEYAGHRPMLVPCLSVNLKITGPADLVLAEAILRLREEGACV